MLTHDLPSSRYGPTGWFPRLMLLMSQVGPNAFPPTRECIARLRELGNEVENIATQLEALLEADTHPTPPTLTTRTDALSSPRPVTPEAEGGHMTTASTKVPRRLRFQNGEVYDAEGGQRIDLMSAEFKPVREAITEQIEGQPFDLLQGEYAWDDGTHRLVTAGSSTA